MIRPMTDEEAKRAIERAKANRFDEAGNYGENNGPLPKMTKQEKLDAAFDVYEQTRDPAWFSYLEAKTTAWAAYRGIRIAAWVAYEEEVAKIEEEYKDD